MPDRQEAVISSERHEVDALVEHLHLRAEREKALLVRELHDNLGGFLVAALMDATWTEKNLLDTEGTRLRLRRIIQALRSGIDLKRGLIEGIKPSLLEDIGIFSALRGLIRARRADAEPAANSSSNSRERSRNCRRPRPSRSTALPRRAWS